ncbi:hypothetical protein BsWGS_17778 [Bradybaena similaris]
MELHLQLEIWRGNVAGAVQIARQQNELSDWIVAIAPHASNDLWELVSLEYAEQLEEDGQYLKAVTYLLAARKVNQAIDLLRKHKLFSEAVSLTKMRLSPVDPSLEDLYTEWGQSLMKDGQFEEAAKCYLAMRNIQEARKAQVSHRDELHWKIPNHTVLMGSDNPSELVYSYCLLTHHLVLGEWQEAYAFLQKSDSLKVLLPFVSTHELLVQQLTALNSSLTLTHKPVTPEMFTQWEKKKASASRIELPDYLLDKSETDPVIPWEPFLVGKHTFPHHLLQVWHKHLNVTMVSQELRSMYRSISQLAAQREHANDLPSRLVLVSLDVTLCLLTLLMSETARAITHMLQVMFTLHKGNHSPLLQAMCRLTLPQGPKYLLKLQQEFNASRVLITMESDGDMSKTGGENHNTFKKFLTDIKDDGAISMSSSRCRDLDCLRAYYYLAVLDFLKDKLLVAQHENESHDGMPNGNADVNHPNIAGMNVNQINLINKEHSKSRMCHEQFKTVSLLESPIVNIQPTKGVRQFNTTPWNIPQVYQDDLLSLSDNSLVTTQSPDQTDISDGSYQVVFGSKNKESDQQLTHEDDQEITIAIDSQSKLPTSPFHNCMPLLGSTSLRSHSPISNTSIATSEYVPVDSLTVPSKLPFLKNTSFKSVLYHNSASLKSFLRPSPDLKSSLSWPSYSPLFLSPSNSPLSLSPQSGSPTSISPPSMSSPSISSASYLSWPINSLLSLSVSTSPSTRSPSSSPLSSPLRSATNSAKDIQKCANRSLSEVEKFVQPIQPIVRKEDLNYVNLLRLSKGILWDAQAKTEALTKTLAYMHYSISQHLLHGPSDNHTSCDSSAQTKPIKDMDTVTQHHLNELAEDGGFTSSCLLPGSLSPLSDSASEYSNTIPSNIKYENLITLPSSSNLDLAKPSSLQMQTRGENELQSRAAGNCTEMCAPYKKSSASSVRLEHSIPLKIETDLHGHQVSEPVTFQKSRKVIWRDGMQTCNLMGTDKSKSACQVSRLAPDGSVIPLEWDELPVDIKYTMPYVTLALLNQEQESISQELKRLPDVSKVPFPSVRTGVKSLLHASLASPHISAKEKTLYYKQLNDWATLFAVTNHERQDTDAMFQAAFVEYLSESS